MASAEDIKKLKILTGEKNEELLSVLLDEAEAFVLSYTNRKQLRTGLEKDECWNAGFPYTRSY